MESQQITINIKLSAEKTFALQVASDSTILDLKKAAFDQVQAKPEELKVIFKGKILKDADVLSQNKVDHNSTLHMVVVKQSTDKPAEPQQTQPTQPAQSPFGIQQPNNPMGGLAGMMGGMPGGMPGMGGMPGGMPGMGGMPGGMDPSMFQGPEFQQMLQSVMSNPQMIQNMIQSNPMLQNMVSQNPQLASMLNDPNTLNMLSNPAVIQQAMSMMGQQGGQGGQGGMPGMPGMGGMPGGMPGMGGMPGGMPDFSSLLGQMNQQPAQQQAGNSNQAPEERFKDQLQMMQDMGFQNKQTNIEALVATNGNVEAAIERLLQMLG